MSNPRRNRRCATANGQEQQDHQTKLQTNGERREGRIESVRAHLRAMTADLLALGDWLRFHGVTHMAMESTGVLWRPTFTMLEEERMLILVNAQHIKAVPGSKTDVKDSEWLADLLRHGLLKASFVPPPATRILRDLTRYRRMLVELRT